MRIHGLRFVISALVSGALCSGCAGGGSSVTQGAAVVPSSVQRASVPGGKAATGGQAPSGIRRRLSVPTCSGIGSYSFLGGPGGGGNNLPNVAGAQYSVVGGGSGNQACDGWSTIAGGFENAISGTDGDVFLGFIGGGQANTITGSDEDSAIVAGYTNTLSGEYEFIGGGFGNNLGGEYGAIAGGDENAMNGEYGFIGAGSTNTLSAEYGVLVGGLNNTVSGEGAYIAAGGYNTASGEGAVVDGGFNSTANGNFATIPGGYANTAGGTYSFAAGARANASRNGTFVWSDGSDGDTYLSALTAYQFLARASGGFTFLTNAGGTVGAQLAAGSGTWASLSDRNVKTNIVPLDDTTVLDKVAALPISRWSYKSEHGVRHVGPMAQDFYAAFKVGEDDKHITAIDEDGVALAAIKALHAENAALRAQLVALKASQARHDLLVDRRLERLTVAVSASRER